MDIASKPITKISRSDQIRVQKLQKNLDKFRVELEQCDYINEEKKFFEIMQSFWNFISNFDDQKTCELFEHSEYFSKYKYFFSAQENYYTRIHETVGAISIMTRQDSNEKSFFELFDHQMSKERYLKTNEEIQLLDFKNAKQFVFIGCGALPETILYIAENTNIENLIALDANQEAIYIAGKMLHALNVSRIKLKHFNPFYYDYNEADIIYLSNVISPKKDILKQIAKTAKNDVQILVRNPILLGRMLYESATKELYPRLVIVKKGKINKYFLDEPLILKKFDI